MINNLSIFWSFIQRRYTDTFEWRQKIKKNLTNEIQKSLSTIRDMDYITAVFISFVIIVYVFSEINSVYDSGFLNSLLGNLNASIWEFLVLGVILFFFEKRRQNESSISDLLSDLENYGTASELALDIQRLKIIKELNRRGCFDIKVQGIKLQSMSAVKGLKFIDAQIAELSFHSSTLNNCEFINCDIRNLCLVNAKLKNVKFTNCKMKNSDFKEGKFSGLTIEDCTLDGTDMSDADLQSCLLAGNKFNGANFSKANLKMTNLTKSTNLNAQQLATAGNLDYIKCDQHILRELTQLRDDIKMAKGTRR